jgi:hypothetical protein
MLTKNNKSCELSAEIVAYMYDELSLDDRAGFETHLADCTLCIDEFAEVSNARFAVYEWHKEAFEPLATPEFSIPYRPVQLAGEVRGGWFEALVGIFAIARTPVFAATAVLVVFGLGFAAFTLMRSSGQEIATNTVPAPVVITVDPVNNKPEITPMSSAPAPEPDEIVVAAPIEKPRQVRPAYAAERTRPAVKTPTPARYAKKAPKLTDIPDDEDKSLRLADLFDGIGG